MERLKWVATWFTAGLQHVFQSWKKPFNPILGETWQAVQAGGSQIALEQISHHPAISAFQMIGPGEALPGSCLRPIRARGFYLRQWGGP